MLRSLRLAAVAPAWSLPGNPEGCTSLAFSRACWAPFTLSTFIWGFQVSQSARTGLRQA